MIERRAAAYYMGFRRFPQQLSQSVPFFPLFSQDSTIKRCTNVPYFCTMCGPEKLGIVDQNWLERICPICC